MKTPTKLAEEHATWNAEQIERVLRILGVTVVTRTQMRELLAMNGKQLWLHSVKHGKVQK